MEQFSLFWKLCPSWVYNVEFRILKVDSNKWLRPAHRCSWSKVGSIQTLIMKKGRVKVRYELNILLLRTAQLKARATTSELNRKPTQLLSLGAHELTWVHIENKVGAALLSTQSANWLMLSPSSDEYMFVFHIGIEIDCNLLGANERILYWGLWHASYLLIFGQ